MGYVLRESRRHSLFFGFMTSNAARLFDEVVVDRKICGHVYTLICVDIRVADASLVCGFLIGFPSTVDKPDFSLVL